MPYLLYFYFLLSVFHRSDSLLFFVCVRFCLSHTEGTSAAVDDIVICARRADEADLLDRGYEKLQPQLKAVGLGKVLCPYRLL